MLQEGASLICLVYHYIFITRHRACHRKVWLVTSDLASGDTHLSIYPFV